MNSSFRPKFYLSLDVESLHDSIDFYTTLFGIPPAVLKSDSAVFDVNKPALHLTIQSKSHCCLQGLNHMGMEMETMEEMRAVQSRLNAAGFKTGSYSTASSSPPAVTNRKADSGSEIPANIAGRSGS